jgi:hypothetical protein
MSIVTSLADMAALGSNDTDTAQTAAASKWDLAWVDDLKGKHMQVYDMADADRSSERFKITTRPPRRRPCATSSWTSPRSG